MAESNGSLWEQPSPGWFREDYLHKAGGQTHRDYFPSLSRSLCEDFRDYIAGRKDNTAHEEARKIRGTRRGKEAHITRLVNQINRHIDKQLSKETIASLNLNLEKAVSQLENINQTLFELNPDDDEPEYDCFDNIEIYYAKRATLDAKLVKEVDVVLDKQPSNPLGERVDKSFSYDNSKSETSVVQRLPSTVHQPGNIGTSQVTQPPITAIENRVPNATSTSNLSTIPATSCTTPKVSLTHPRTVTSLTDSIPTPVVCCKPPSNPDQTSTPATQNSPWRGWTLPSQVSSHPKQISTPATQNVPWRGWTVPSQCVLPRPSLSGTLPQPHSRWGLTPDFP